jgi:putative heme-binding domain-containing protein
MSMIGKQRLRVTAMALTISAVTGLASAQTFTPPGEGKKLFDGLCQDCHGINGIGDEAPSLNRPLAADDATLRRIMLDGLPARGMPRVRRMTVEEADVLVAYVRSLGRGAPTRVTGNAQNGHTIYDRLDCKTCHVIGGQGGVLGPELTTIGRQRAPAYLRQTLLEPGSSLPKGSQGIMQNGFTEYLPVSVVSRDGREVRGIRVNEDSFTIQLRDDKGAYYSFRKSEVRNVEKQFGRSFMPSYKDKLKPNEVEDLIAYLASLGGAR